VTSGAPPAPPPSVAAPTSNPTQPTSTYHHSDDGGSRTGSSSGQTGGSAPAPASAGATFADAGGTVTVACQGSSISLTSATPFDGYSLTVQNSGPLQVVVTFTGNGSTFTIRAHCYNGQPVQGWGGGGGSGVDH
jgi:hypothetical protein